VRIWRGEQLSRTQLALTMVAAVFGANVELMSLVIVVASVTAEVFLRIDKKGCPPWRLGGRARAVVLGLVGGCALSMFATSVMTLAA
jgi:hypothetical protein